MYKNKHFVHGFIVLVIVFSIPFPIYALTISEIMYDVAGTDTGREWIEVRNTTTKALDIASYIFLENNVNHTIGVYTSYADPAPTLPVDGYAIIADNPAKFLEDWPDFKGFLFDSAFSLSNTGEMLRLIDSYGETVDTREYTGDIGAKGDGFSLQYIDNVLRASKPTPGDVNVATATTSTTTTASSSTTTTGTGSINSTSTVPITTQAANVSTHTSQIDLVSAVEKISIKISAGRDRLTTINTPISFSGAIADNDTIGKITFYWNFGDGNTAKGRVVDHVYEYPGLYSVVLNAVSGKERATSRTDVVVVEPSVSVESSTNTVVVHNNASLELNIGDFILKNDGSSYIFPKDTIIQAHTAVPFSRHLFPKLGTSTVDILFPNRQPVQQP